MTHVIIGTVLKFVVVVVVAYCLWARFETSMTSLGGAVQKTQSAVTDILPR